MAGGGILHSAFETFGNYLRGSWSSEAIPNVQHDASHAQSEPTYASTPRRSPRSRPMSTSSGIQNGFLGSSVQKLPVGKNTVVLVPKRPVNPLRDLGEVVHV